MSESVSSANIKTARKAVGLEVNGLVASRANYPIVRKKACDSFQLGDPQFAIVCRELYQLFLPARRSLGWAFFVTGCYTYRHGSFLT